MKKFILFLLLLIVYNSTFAQNEPNEKQKQEFDEKFFDAETYRIKGNYQKSNQLFLDALNIEPSNDALLFKIAQNYYDLKNFYQATEYLNQAIKINPDNKWYKYLEIQIAIAEKKDKNEVRKMIEKFRPVAKNKYLIASLYKDLFYHKKTTKTSIKPHATSHSNFELMFKNKNFEALISSVDKQLENTPDNPLLYLWGAKAHRELKKYKKALEYLNLGIDFANTNPDVLKKYYKEYITIYQALNKPEKVKKYKQKLNKI